jgi:hypothetical protein
VLTDKALTTYQTMMADWCKLNETDRFQVANAFGAFWAAAGAFTHITRGNPAAVNLGTNTDIVPEQGYVPVAEAANRLGVSAETIRQRISKHLLHGKRINGRLCVPTAELANYTARAN